MDYKKIKTDTNAITRNLNDFDKETGNIYETINILAKRSNQIAVDLKEELNEKIKDFATHDTSEDGAENKEQIELVRFYEQMPKPTLLAIQEFKDGQIYYKEPEEEN
ncbi:MAG: DNA-directed RNA polymerase subunit omega [Bacteroidales bacterium]|nr:DNA-directed RNA polymerase subunit omega [Bacteroidales bacterium]